MKIHAFDSFFNNKKTSKNKSLCLRCIILILFSLLCMFSNNKFEVFANNNAETELINTINNEMSEIDLSEMDKLIKDINTADVFNISFKDKVLDLINGKFEVNFSSVLSLIVSVIISQVKNILPVLISILAIGILANIISSIKGSSDVTNIVHFVCFAVVVSLIIANITNILNMTKTSLNQMTNQMQVLFPIILTMLASVGSLVSVSIFKPMVAILTSGVTVVFNNILYPIFFISFILVVVNSLSDTIKLNKFIGFLNSAFKIIMGFVFTIFAGLLSVQGISAGRFDAVSIKTAKFAVKSYIPLIGGYISDGLDFIVLGSVLIKNAIGVAGILLIIFTIILPIINILIFKLGLQLTSSVVDIAGSSKVSNFINEVSKILIYPVVLILGVAFMYILSMGLMMSTANLV